MKQRAMYGCERRSGTEYSVLLGRSCSEAETIPQRHEGGNGTTPPTQAVMGSPRHISTTLVRLVRKKKVGILKLEAASDTEMNP